MERDWLRYMSRFCPSASCSALSMSVPRITGSLILSSRAFLPSSSPFVSISSSLPRASTSFCLTLSRCGLVALSSAAKSTDESAREIIDAALSSEAESVGASENSESSDMLRFTAGAEPISLFRLRCFCLQPSTSSRALARTASSGKALAIWFTVLPMSVSPSTLVERLPSSPSAFRASVRAAGGDSLESRVAFRRSTSAVMASESCSLSWLRGVPSASSAAAFAGLSVAGTRAGASAGTGLVSTHGSLPAGSARLGAAAAPLPAATSPSFRLAQPLPASDIALFQTVLLRV
mmetsp:Transcript_28052/g.79284  ORF Transcript_28052/g.79284 Transcript_28052/m.79284 type:complete len:292 (+) Transcript_28052:599-1474(+)